MSDRRSRSRSPRPPRSRSRSRSPNATSASERRLQMQARPATTLETISTSGDREVVQMGEHEVAFVLGRGGVTKTKLGRVSRCRLEVDSTGRMEIIGRPSDRERAKAYIGLVLAQRVGPVYIDFNAHSQDLTTMKVPRDCVGYVTGRNGAALRGIEEEFNVLMFFARDKATESERASSPFGRSGDRPEEILAIFGEARNRCGAELKVMSSIEHKVPGHYVKDDNLREPFDKYNDGDNFVIECVPLAESDFSYALGKMGQTRKKLARAAGCILQYIAQLAVFAGPKYNVDCGRQYLKWLMQQRTGGVAVDDKSRTDITVLPVASRVVGFVTGARGSNLRDVEERSGTFCFTDGDKGVARSPSAIERVCILSTDPESRRIAERLILDRIAIKEHEVTGSYSSSSRGRSRSPYRGGGGGSYGRSPPRDYRPRSPYRGRSRSPPRDYRPRSPYRGRSRSPPRSSSSYRPRSRSPPRYDSRDRYRDDRRERQPSPPRYRERERSLR